MAQDFVRYSAQATNSASTIFTANSNDAVIGIRIANIVRLQQSPLMYLYTSNRIY
jgi:hypothetical protein